MPRDLCIPTLQPLRLRESFMDTANNVLFGILALQANLINAAQFAEACRAWAAHRGVSLAELLVAGGLITPVDQTAIALLVDVELKQRRGAVDGGLAAADEKVRRA